MNSPTNPSWKTLEESVRSIARLKWKCEAAPEHLGGVNFDAVLRPSAEEIILIEITKETALDKIREDINKINLLRLGYLAERMFCRGYVVMHEAPTLSMVESGKINKIQVLSAEDFTRLFFDREGYKYQRSKFPFGSAFDPFTGKGDEIAYIPVNYSDESGLERFDAKRVLSKLLEGRKLVLVGDYGTGKSRCIKQVFDLLNGPFALPGRIAFAINLRDHWGASTASEIIAGHLEEIGLSNSIDNAMQIIRAGGVTLLLDGVDEVGAQIVDSDKERRRALRRKALEGVRKLIDTTLGGVLITSRSHYFDGDEEMLAALGLSQDGASAIIKCPDEFEESEAQAYLNSIGVKQSPPSWLPRKPLVFQVISTLRPEQLDSIIRDESGELTFWGKFLSTVCTRESLNIQSVIDPETVKNIIVYLAERTREQAEPLGRLSTSLAREAFIAVTGEHPDEAGEQLLMRLCTLGRIDPGSPDRQFVDPYIVDGLRAEGLISTISQQRREFSNKVWKQALGRLGWSLLSDHLHHVSADRLYVSSMAMAERGGNDQAYAEILSALLEAPGESIILSGQVIIQDCRIHYLRIGERRVTNLKILNSYIHNLEVLSEKEDSRSNIIIESCVVDDLAGISNDKGLPSWIVNTEVGKYENMSKAAQIKGSDLSPGHKLFVAIVHKIFFQHGSGREERSLLKGGFGQQADQRLLHGILNSLQKEDIIRKSIGSEGPVYLPNRKHMSRMSMIKAQLSLSSDPLWARIGELKS